MPNQRPHFLSIEVNPARWYIMRFDLQSLHNPHGNIRDYQKRYQFSTWLLLAKIFRIAASSQTVHHERSLDYHLCNFKNTNQNRCDMTKDYWRNNTGYGVEEIGGNAEVEQKIVENWYVAMTDIKLGSLAIGEERSNCHDNDNWNVCHYVDCCGIGFKPAKVTKQISLKI